MAPAILLPLTWLLRERIWFSPRVLLATWGGFFVVAVLVMVRIKGLLGVAYEPDAASMFGQQEMLQGLATPHLLSVLTQAGLFFKYLLLMLVPNPAWMSIDMRETFLLSYREWTNWLGLVAFVSYGLVALWSVLRGGRVALLGLALLYPWLLFMTEFSSVRVQESFVLYRAYLWMPGVMLLLPLLVISLPDKKIMWAGALVVALLVPLSWNRLWVMGDNYRLWDDAVKLLHGEDRLGSQRTYYNRALYAAQLKNWDGAIADYQKSLAIDSSHSQVFIALASAFYGAKRYDDALSTLEQVIGKDAKNAQAHYSKSMVLRAMGDKVGALQSLETSCGLGNEMGCMLINYAKQQKN
jgi:tetratricopeptide (TPR) repeat protein